MLIQQYTPTQRIIVSVEIERDAIALIDAITSGPHTFPSTHGQAAMLREKIKKKWLNSLQISYGEVPLSLQLKEVRTKKRKLNEKLKRTGERLRDVESHERKLLGIPSVQINSSSYEEEDSDDDC